MVKNKAQVIEADQRYMREIPLGRQNFLTVVEVQNYKIDKELKIDRLFFCQFAQFIRTYK